MPKILTPI